MTIRERNERRQEMIFWGILIAAMLFVITMMSIEFYNWEVVRTECKRSCSPYLARLIDDRCHCRYHGGWKEALPSEVMEER